ncbi:MAG: hypothetical protein KZQ87_15755 [Candidatus Thiodiazotropha sp. (ex Cardiolucina cf. quadrata)]|nr:hypothetical protein [Candidatus Thiodiazotropha sp. (ex Cardiolucina cf. quadrata)]
MGEKAKRVAAFRRMQQQKNVRKESQSQTLKHSDFAKSLGTVKGKSEEQTESV